MNICKEISIPDIECCETNIGGYNIKSCFYDKDNLSCDKSYIDTLKDKYIPPGLLSLQHRLISDINDNKTEDKIRNILNIHSNNQFQDYEDDNEDNVISENLYDKLLQLANSNNLVDNVIDNQQSKIEISYQIREIVELHVLFCLILS